MKRHRYKPPESLPKLPEEMSFAKPASIDEDALVARAEESARAVAMRLAQRIESSRVGEASINATFERDKHERIRSFDVTNTSGALVARGEVERDGMGYMTSISLRRVG